MAGLQLNSKDGGNTKVQTSNIKVVARFRPMNTMEQDLIQSGLGYDCTMFPNDRSVTLLPDSNTVWTFDKVFPPVASQVEKII